MFTHAHRVAPEKTDYSARSCAMLFKADMELIMKEKIVSREKLFSFKTNSFSETDVFLTIREGNEPLIETEPGVLNRKVGNEIRLSQLLQVIPIERDILQIVGDGPYFDKLDKEHVTRAAQEALNRIDKSVGEFKVVWVPNDGLPY